MFAAAITWGRQALLSGGGGRRKLYTGRSSGPAGVGGPPRRVPQRRAAGEPAAGVSGSNGSNAAVGGAGAAGARAGEPSLMEMNREVPGGAKPLRSWEKWYWGAGVGGVSLFLFWRMRPEAKTPEQLEAERQAAADLEVRRRDHLRALLATRAEGGFIAPGDDPLDGLSPAQIEALMAAAGIDPGDPLEGMSPEEIDEYMARQEAAAAAKAAAAAAGGAAAAADAEGAGGGGESGGSGSSSEGSGSGSSSEGSDGSDGDKKS